MTSNSKRQAPTNTGVVHIVEDNSSARRSLAALVELAGWRVEAFASVTALLAHPRSNEASCLVLDAGLLGSMETDTEGAATLDQLGAPIILLGPDDVATAVRAIKAGAVEFLTKPINAWALLRAIDDAITISHDSFEARLYACSLRARFALLSPRERQVMMLVAQGLLNKQVGGRLGISEITVKAHRGQAMRKMGARSFAELVHMARQLSTPDHVSGCAWRFRGQAARAGESIVQQRATSSSPLSSGTTLV